MVDETFSSARGAICLLLFCFGSWIPLLLLLPNPAADDEQDTSIKKESEHEGWLTEPENLSPAYAPTQTPITAPLSEDQQGLLACIRAEKAALRAAPVKDLKIASLSKVNKDLSTRNAGLLALNDALTTSNTQRIASINSLEASITRLSNANNSLKTMVAGLQTQHKEQNTTTASLRKEVERLAHRSNTMHAAAVRLEKPNNAPTTRSKELENLVHDYDSALKTLQSKSLTSTRTINDLKDERLRTKALHSTALSEVEDSRLEAAATIARLTEERTTLTVELKNSKLEMVHLRNECHRHLTAATQGFLDTMDQLKEARLWAQGARAWNERSTYRILELEGEVVELKEVVKKREEQEEEELEKEDSEEGDFVEAEEEDLEVKGLEFIEGVEVDEEGVVEDEEEEELYAEIGAAA